MSKLIKEFKTGDLLAYERKHGEVLEKLTTNTSDLVTLIRLGNGGCTEERAIELLEDYVKGEANDYVTALMEVMEALQLMGKLPKQINLEKMREKLTQNMANI